MDIHIFPVWRSAWNG